MNIQDDQILLRGMSGTGDYTFGITVQLFCDHCASAIWLLHNEYIRWPDATERDELKR